MTYSKTPRPIKLKAPKTTVSQIKGEHVFWPLAGAFLGNILAPGIGGLLAGSLIGGAVTLTDKEKKMAKIPVFYSFHFANDVM